MKRKSLRRFKKDEMSLEINSLLDILVILLVFLIKNFSATNIDIPIPKELVVPISKSLETNEDAVTVSLTKENEVYVNQEVVDEPVEITLRRCVEQMLAYLDSARTAAGCDDYDMAVQSDRSSPYSMMPVAAACIRMECSGTQLEGHNGYMATRTCQDLDDLKATLSAAEEDATAGSCGTPTFQTRLLTLDEFVDQVPCDALTCGLAPDGEVIAVDQRY